MPSESVLSELLAKFAATYGRDPAVVAYAPGRIEVLGNHTDYNEGYVLSAAIDYGTFFAAAPRDDGTARLTAGDVMETVEFPAAAPERSESASWSNYVKGCVALLGDRLGPPDRGFDAMFLGNVPLGSGLSSSAALECSAILALARLRGASLPKLDVAKMGQRAENEWAGVKCGLLDQASSVFGEKDALVMSDVRTCEFKPVSFPPDVCFLMCNTHAKHALVDGAYASRRQACEDAAKYFAGVLRKPVTHLRDVTMAEWVLYRGGLSETTAKRAVHPIGEDERVLQGAALLEKGDLKCFGALMYDSHESSRNWFENSCEELDTIVDAAKAIPEVLGARLSGGGFGGSCCLLVRPEAADKIAAQITQAYKTAYGDEPTCAVIKPSAGAHLVNE